MKAVTHEIVHHAAAKLILVVGGAEHRDRTRRHNAADVDPGRMTTSFIAHVPSYKGGNAQHLAPNDEALDA